MSYPVSAQIDDVETYLLWRTCAYAFAVIVLGVVSIGMIM